MIGVLYGTWQSHLANLEDFLCSKRRSNQLPIIECEAVTGMFLIEKKVIHLYYQTILYSILYSMTL